MFYQMEMCIRDRDKTPYWRTLKANGELNAKYPGGVEAQKEMLEKEGHTVIQKGRTNVNHLTALYSRSEKAPDNEEHWWRKG